MAQTNLGSRLADGRGVAKNEAEAAKWLRKAAEQGFAPAQLYIGEMYLSGRGGFLQDDLQALALFRKSAATGLNEALFALGTMYQLGRGLDKNDVLAYAYLNLAAANGHDAAEKERNAIFATLKPAQVKEGQALSSSWKPGQLLPDRTKT